MNHPDSRSAALYAVTNDNAQQGNAELNPGKVEISVEAWLNFSAGCARVAGSSRQASKTVTD